LSAELTKTHSFRLFFEISHWADWTLWNNFVMILSFFFFFFFQLNHR